MIKKTIIREYIFSQGELKKLLGMKGNILLYEGISPQAEQQGKSKDNVKWVITTEEKEEL